MASCEQTHSESLRPWYEPSVFVFCPVTGPLKAVTVKMEQVEEEALVSGLKSKLEEDDLNLEQKVSLLNDGLNSETTPTALVCLRPVFLPYREPHCFITCLFVPKGCSL